jgi:N-acetylmuramic acid 6-phosphate etherase
MVKLGKVYNNLMVDVHASNTKLVERSIRIVQTVTGVDATIANNTLKQAGGSAKIAIVMLAKGINQIEAVTLLEKYDGFLRPILTEAAREDISL